MTTRLWLLLVFFAVACGSSESPALHSPGADAGADAGNDVGGPEPPSTWLLRVGSPGVDRILYLDVDAGSGDVFVGLELAGEAMLQGHVLSGMGILRLDRFGRYLGFFQSPALIGPAQQFWAISGLMILNLMKFEVFSAAGDPVWAPEGRLGWVHDLDAGPSGTLFGQSGTAKPIGLGTTSASPFPDGNYFLFELQPRGELLWLKQYPAAASAGFVRTSKGQLWAFHRKKNCPSPDFCYRELHLAGHDAQGNPLWSRHVTDENNNNAVEAEPTPDGGAVMLADLDGNPDDILVQRFGPGGETRYEAIFSGDNMGDKDLAVDYLGRALLSVGVSPSVEIMPGTVLAAERDEGAVLVLDEHGAVMDVIRFLSDRPSQAPWIEMGLDRRLVVAESFATNLRIGDLSVETNSGEIDIFVGSLGID